MGCDAISYFPDGTRQADVEEFLRILGFQSIKRSPFSARKAKAFSYYDDDDYRHITGLYIELYRSDEDPVGLQLRTRTTIWRSKFDNDLHNRVLRQLRKRFSGNFVSDYGKNRYFPYDGPVREKAEAGAFTAYGVFYQNLQRAQRLQEDIAEKREHERTIPGFDFLDTLNPRIIAANLLLPFLVGSLEDYLRSLYIALLRYSPKRDDVLARSQIRGADLSLIEEGQASVIEILAKQMSFQNLDRANDAFKGLDQRYDLYGLLI